MVKEDEKASNKRKTTPEPKAAAAAKRKAESPEPKISEAAEETPSTPPSAEITEILKVTTESLPVKMLSPLGPELMKLLQKKNEPSATKKADGQKKQRIITVMQAIERTPLWASASKITPVASAEAATEAKTSAEDANLESTLFGIDKILLGMAVEETAAAIEKAMAIVLGKGKKIANVASEEMEFDFRNLVGQELSEAEKELQEYGISCGYQPGAMLFGGIDERALGCIRDRDGAKIIGTLSKSVGFPKLEADISGYRWQQIVGSLFYSNFKVKFLLLSFF
jgi:hypothetical protein